MHQWHHIPRRTAHQRGRDILRGFLGSARSPRGTCRVLRTGSRTCGARASTAEVSPAGSGSQHVQCTVSTKISIFIFHDCSTAPRSEKGMKEYSANFFSLSPGKLLFNPGVCWALITESEQKATRYFQQCHQEQESKVQQIRGPLFSVFHFKKRIMFPVCIGMSASCLRAHFHDTSRYFPGYLQEWLREEAPLLVWPADVAF